MSEPPQKTGRHEQYVWPLLFMFVVIVPQVVIPARNRVGPPSIVPIAELALLAVIVAIAARPGPMPRGSRPLVLSLFGLLVVANIGAAAHLVGLVLTENTIDGVVPSATRLLVTGVTVLATNTVTFGLLYWQLDGGGPRAREDDDPDRYVDFQFPQTSEPGLAAPGWTPLFFDYLYVAYTGVVAFSPTDTLPLTHRAKGLMAAQSIVALSVIVVVLARVINILPSSS
ncbi:MAG: hypothetical protein L0H96_09380 [Humibacillus sp.]|nr:hypothetical protein [Humibacillus sp.]MDN5777110.1 hypothetical protein [Humibacillus sp.]